VHPFYLDSIALSKIADTTCSEHFSKRQCSNIEWSLFTLNLVYLKVVAFS
jgi:hypothetical protein